MIVALAYFAKSFLQKKIDKTKRSINLTIELTPIVTENIDTWSTPTPMQREENSPKAVLIEGEEVEGVTPHMMSNQLKNERQMDWSSGWISHLEISYAKASDSRGNTSTEMMILCERQNQKISRAKTFGDNLGLHMLIMPRRFIAFTCKTTIFTLHWLTSACKHLPTPNNSRYVEDWAASHSEKYACTT